MDGNVAFRLLENERELMVRTWSSMAVFCSPFDGGDVGPATFVVHDG
jgi:hypothetical protein